MAGPYEDRNPVAQLCWAQSSCCSQRWSLRLSALVAAQGSLALWPQHFSPLAHFSSYH